MPICQSTNDIATHLIRKSKCFEGTLVITDHQLAGKGQKGSTWESSAYQNLTFSLIFQPKFLKTKDLFYLNIISSLAIYDCLSPLAEDKPKIKWPNDIYLLNKKIAGILIENTVKRDNVETAVIGIGLNVNQQFFSDNNAISLHNACHRVFDLRRLLSSLLCSIEKRYMQLRQLQFDHLLHAYHQKMYWINEIHHFKAHKDFQGRIIGVDNKGRLLIETQEEVKCFVYKEVQFVA